MTLGMVNQFGIIGESGTTFPRCPDPFERPVERSSVPTPKLPEQIESRKKVCTKCGYLKTLDNFQSKGSGRRRSDCKACVKKYDASKYEENREAIVAKYRTEEYRAFSRGRKRDRSVYLSAYKKRNRNKLNEWHDRYVSHNPEKIKAKTAVNNAVAAGKLKREPCEVCGDPKSQGHHDDYSKPLIVRWLCAFDHKEHHRLKRERERQQIQLR